MDYTDEDVKKFKEECETEFLFWDNERLKKLMKKRGWKPQKEKKSENKKQQEEQAELPGFVRPSTKQAQKGQALKLATSHSKAHLNHQAEKAVLAFLGTEYSIKTNGHLKQLAKNGRPFGKSWEHFYLVPEDGIWGIRKMPNGGSMRSRIFPAK